MMKIIAKILFLFGLMPSLMAQEVDDSSKWQIDASTQFGLFNYEWPVEGYTTFGWSAPLMLSYQSSERVTFQLGGHFFKLYGSEKNLDNAELVSRLILNMTPNQQLIAGSLLSIHGLHESIHIKDRAYYQYTEQGLQYKLTQKNDQLDIWVDWLKKESLQSAESFDVGLVYFKVLNKFKFNYQMIIGHTDGQLTQDDTSERALYSQTNLSYQILKTTNVGAKFLYSYYAINDLGITRGKGFELDVIHRLNAKEGVNKEAGPEIDISGSAYIGDDFYSTSGSLAYQAASYYSVGISSLWQIEQNLQLSIGTQAQWINDEFASSQFLSIQWTDQLFSH